MRRTHPADHLADFTAKLRERGLAVTIQRRVVYEELAARHDHPTSDQIFEAVSTRVPGLSRTTVYRVLEALVDAGLARRVHHAGPAARFDPAMERHHHLLCERCGALTDLPDGEVPQVPPPRGRAGFVIRDYTVTFTGLCPGCSGRRQPTTRGEARWPESSRARRPTST